MTVNIVEPVHGDCRSSDGITVGLVDAVITVARVLAARDLSPPAVREALADLRDDECVATLLGLGPGAGELKEETIT